MLEDFPAGLRHLGIFMQNELITLVEEYKSLEESYKEELRREIVQEEKRLKEKREYFIWPEQTV